MQSSGVPMEYQTVASKVADEALRLRKEAGTSGRDLEEGVEPWAEGITGSGLGPRQGSPGAQSPARDNNERAEVVCLAIPQGKGNTSFKKALEVTIKSQLEGGAENVPPRTDKSPLQMAAERLGSLQKSPTQPHLQRASLVMGPSPLEGLFLPSTPSPHARTSPGAAGEVLLGYGEFVTAFGELRESAVEVGCDRARRRKDSRSRSVAGVGCSPGA